MPLLTLAIMSPFKSLTSQNVSLPNPSVLILMSINAPAQVRLWLGKELGRPLSLGDDNTDGFGDNVLMGILLVEGKKSMVGHTE